MGEPHLLHRVAGEDRGIVQVVAGEEQQVGGCLAACHGRADKHHPGQPQQCLRTHVSLFTLPQYWEARFLTALAGPTVPQRCWLTNEAALRGQHQW